MKQLTQNYGLAFMITAGAALLMLASHVLLTLGVTSIIVALLVAAFRFFRRDEK